MSKKVIVSADGNATVSDATIMDTVTTLFSTDTAVTGTLAIVQKVALVAGGMAIQNYRLGRGLNFLQS